MRIPKPAKRGRKPPRPIARGQSPRRLRKRASIGELRKLGDDLMSLYVRHKAVWVCWLAGSMAARCDPSDDPSQVMQMAHLFGKKAHPGGRYLRANVRCLCARCHTYYTHHPTEWFELLQERLGDPEYRRVRDLVDVRGGHDYKAEVVYWYTKLRARKDAWKVRERLEKLEARMDRLGVEVRQ